jgi:hypothetical protein
MPRFSAARTTASASGCWLGRWGASPTAAPPLLRSPAPGLRPPPPAGLGSAARS